MKCKKCGKDYYADGITANQNCKDCNEPKMKGLTLFELDDNFVDVSNRIIDNDGVIDPILENEYNKACDSIVKKETGYLHVIETFDSQTDKLDEIINRLQNRKKVLANQKSRLEKRLIEHLQFIEKDQIETEIGIVKLQSSKKVKNLDLSEYPPEYIKIIQEKKLDKSRLKKDAKTNPKLQEFIEDSYFLKKY